MKKMSSVAGTVLMALCLAASNATAKTRIHGKTSPILKAVNEACKDRWCERGNVDDIKFDRLWCDHTSCLLSYVVHTTGSPHASRKVCRLSNIRHVQDAMQTKQGTTALSEALLADIDACFP